MKSSKKLILIIILTLLMSISFLIPKTTAQEWTYDGVDTTNIPGFSVYPSEWYLYNSTTSPSDILFLLEINHGNITDPGMGNGTIVWTSIWDLNTTSGEKTLGMSNVFTSYWNETVGFISAPFVPIIPIENNGKVTLPILNNVSALLNSPPYPFEYQQIYPTIYSIEHWNTSNNAYLKLNYTDDGILTQWESYLLPINPLANMTLYSQPAQLPPSFSFTTEDDNLTLTSTDMKLNITVNAADNNNDGSDDTDYQYRILNGSIWTDWANITGLIDWNIGGVSTGSYPITMEVKNMYGTTQEQIIIDYKTVPEDFILSSDAGPIDADGNFNLNWAVAAGATNYSVFEHSNFITVINGSLTTLLNKTNTLSLPLSGYTNGTYYFIVEAHNNIGDVLSNCIQVVVAIPPETEESVPAIPGYNFFFLLITSVILSSILIRKRHKKL